MRHRNDTCYVYQYFVQSLSWKYKILIQSLYKVQRTYENKISSIITATLHITTYIHIYIITIYYIMYITYTYYIIICNNITINYLLYMHLRIYSIPTTTSTTTILQTICLYSKFFIILTILWIYPNCKCNLSSILKKREIVLSKSMILCNCLYLFLPLTKLLPRVTITLYIKV